MDSKKVFVTIDKLAQGCVLYSNMLNALNILDTNEAFIFYDVGQRELNLSYIVRQKDEDDEDYIIGIDPPIEGEVYSLTKIYSQKKEGFILRKLEAILKTAPVSIIVPNQFYASMLEQEVRSRGLSFELKSSDY